MVARLTLTQEAVVRIHDPEPYMGLIQRQYVGLQNRSLWFESTGPCQYSPVVQMANAPDCLSGDRGQGELPLAAREGGLGRSSPVGVAIWPLSLTG